MRILFIVDPLPSLELAGDTSFALMRECVKRDDEVWTCQIEHLGLEHEDAICEAKRTLINIDEEAGTKDPFICEESISIPLEAFDIVFMRKDPPFDVNYLQATWLLENARGKTLLVNDPRGLRELNEHLSILQFPDLIPPTIVTRSQKRLDSFLDEQGGTIVLKPVDGYAGLGIFVVRQDDPNRSSLFETATRAGAAWTIAQRYLPEAAQGDKRILLVDGISVGAVLRVPKPNEARGNLHIGGQAVKTQLSAREHHIVQTVAPLLAQFGQIFVGIDVIGGRLTEINITSPTGLRHIETLEQRNVASIVMERLATAAKTLTKKSNRQAPTWSYFPLRVEDSPQV